MLILDAFGGASTTTQEIREAAVTSIVSGIFKEAWWMAGNGGAAALADVGSGDALRLEGLDEHVAALRESVADDGSLLLMRWYQLTAAEQAALELKYAQQRFAGTRKRRSNE